MVLRHTDGIEIFEAFSRAEWRAWLAANHERPDGVWLISQKKSSGKPGVPYPEAVEEALCFGWIDSKATRLDEERYMQTFTPRRKKSVWSALNKRRIDALVADGLMTPAGMAKIEEAKRDGSWTALDGIDALTVPPDFQRALDDNPDAATTFATFTPSQVKQVLFFIESAKRPETRAKRIAGIISEAAHGRNALIWKPKAPK
jgi:uncharacterized protein YdeI (YjbR/CyaY-like superfamily)